MKVTINRSEVKALNDLRGLPEDAHMMVMCMESTEDGGVLEGSETAFEALVDFIGEELAEGLVRGDPRHLVSLCEKIDPDCVEWLGQ